MVAEQSNLPSDQGLQGNTMTHISDCMRSDIGLGLNNLIAKGLYSEPPEDEVIASSPPRKATFHSRTSQMMSEPKYRLWPTAGKSPPLNRATTEPERVLALATNRSSSAMGHRSEKAARRMSAGTKPRPGVPLQTRRKVSLAELGPMTTVQEACMDSPTLPIQQPIRSAPTQPSTRERSSSAPRSGWQYSPFGAAMMSNITASNTETDLRRTNPNFMNPSTPPTTYSKSADQTPERPYDSQSTRPHSSRFLPPLMIPAYESLGDPFGSIGQPSIIKFDDADSPRDSPPPVPPKSPRFGRSISPPTRRPPIPNAHVNCSAVTLVNTSRSVTPSSPQEGKASPHQWDRPIPLVSRGREHQKNLSDPQNMAFARPPRRDSLVRPSSTEPRARSSTRRTRQSLQVLPLGFKVSEASMEMGRKEMDKLKDQAKEQASRFEVLSSDSVKSLAQELRELDEQCEYLRRTHNSLRGSRRTLRSRIITYLKSPKMSAFSRKSILKREEALAELELSIDDVVFKLEQAENRRTRVRQKLLEHIAAALTLKRGGAFSIKSQGHDTPPASPESPQKGLRKRSPIESLEISYDATIQGLLTDIERLVGTSPQLS